MTGVRDRSRLDPVVRFEAVGCSYGRVRAISDVTTSIADGEFVGVVGPSGAGKTTLLRALLGVAEPDLLVLDEPAAGVDVATRLEVLHLLADLSHAGLTVLLTTHDVNGLAAHLPRLICLNRTIIADGAAADVRRPDVFEETHRASTDVLQHGGMPVVLEHPGHGIHSRPRDRSAG